MKKEAKVQPKREARSQKWEVSKAAKTGEEGQKSDNKEKDDGASTKLDEEGQNIS